MNNIQKLVIIGAGDAFYEIYDLIEDINKVKKKYKIIGILDDNKDNHLKQKNGITILGGLGLAKTLIDVKFVFGIGSINTQKIRKKLLNKMGLDLDSFETLIHPTAKIHSNVKIGAGCIIHENTFLGIGVELQNFVIVEYSAMLINYAQCKDFSMIATGATVLRNSIIDEAAFIGAKACIGENLKIGKNSIVGMGSIVTKDVADNKILYGVAATEKRKEK